MCSKLILYFGKLDMYTSFSSLRGINNIAHIHKIRKPAHKQHTQKKSLHQKTKLYRTMQLMMI